MNAYALICILMLVCVVVERFLAKHKKKQIEQLKQAEQPETPKLRERLSDDAMGLWLDASEQFAVGQTCRADSTAYPLSTVIELHEAGYIDYFDDCYKEHSKWYRLRLLVRASSIEEMLRKGCANNYDTQTDSD